MNKKVLFTVAGTHDPVTVVEGQKDKCQDGSILSICRNIKPDKVYVYLSKELNELEKKDNRFSSAIKKLNANIEVQLIKSDDENKVADFDYFIDKFKKELIKIKDNEIEDENDVLYVNVSSGTPQMKSALLLLSVWGILNIKCCQVITPKKSANIGENKMIAWTDDIENISDENEDRFKILNESEESAIPNLQCANIEQNIIKLIGRYDYAGALEFVNEIEKINKNRVQKYKRLIEIADKREKLDYVGAKKLLDDKWRDVKLKQEFLSTFIDDNNDNVIRCFEYILNLELKLKSEEFADFYRGINPILYNMYLSFFVKCFGAIEKYSAKEKNELHWDKSKLMLKENMQVYSYLVEGFKEENCEFEPNKGFIDSNTLYIPIIKYLGDTKSDIVNYMKNLEMLRRRRNGIAHDFVKKAISDNTIEEVLDGSYSFKNMDKKTLRSIEWMRRIFVEIFGEIDNNKWKAFNIMNEIIIKRINESN